MAEFKERILSTITNTNEEVLGPFARKDDYLKHFKDMNPITKKSPLFKNSPDGFFENFDYEVFPPNTPLPDVDIVPILSDFHPFLSTNTNRIVMLNGTLSLKNSNIISDGLKIEELSLQSSRVENEVERNFLNYYYGHETQLSTANSLLSPDGTYVHIAENAKIKEPIILLNIITKQDKNYFFNHRRFIEISKNATANFYECNIVLSSHKSVLVDISIASLSENANVTYSLINTNVNDKKDASIIKGFGFTLKENAKLDTFSFHSGYNYERERCQYMLDGKNSSVTITSFAQLYKNNIVDIATDITHTATDTKSEQLAKVIVDDNSAFHFNGRIEVVPNAQRTDSAQSSRALLLSDDATVEFLPQLEINNDDVACSHGAAIGQLDEDSLFYLNSRGIGTDEARKLLLTAFAMEAINKSKLPDELKEHFAELIS
ncbi:MAG: SufD family Fe-S cluster assembly protein [Ignavibacteria bacterium]|jgi:Fe-S cluster assembly protein SufD|nr:SufD family Fe-S cluster assembly protein [Ignavibacteria bacterium]